jgi:uncharacterized protein
MKPLIFFLLVFALSVPFWVLGAIAPDFTKIFPINLPISALMTFCPLMAAVILVYRERKRQGIKDLLSRAFDFKRIKDKKWCLPVVFLMPVIAVLSYFYTKLTGVIIPETLTSVLSIFLFFGIYFIGAIGEEIGWSGYAIDPLQNRFGALKASIVLGVIWAIWHIIPWSQTHQTPVWIIWQSASTVLLRVIMVWLFNNTGKSVFAMILFHTMINISPYLIPGNGAHYDPFITCILLGIPVVCIIVRYKYASTVKKNPVINKTPSKI